MSDTQNTPPKGLGPLVYSIELRDLFAMAALNAIESHNWFARDGSLQTLVADWSYGMADAMIEARERTRK